MRDIALVRPLRSVAAVPLDRSFMKIRASDGEVATGTTERALVLVAAFPQPRARYEEAVASVGITSSGRFVRLYPWRFRQLRPEQRFAAWDTIEYETETPADDRRPETRYVNARSIRIVRPAAQMTQDQRLRVWVDHPCASVPDLRQANLSMGTSLGVVRPDEGSVRLNLRPLDPESPDDQQLQETYRQVAMIEQPSMARASIEVELSYSFTCDGLPLELRIHDWEAHATWFRYKRKHGERAVEKFRQKYEQNLPSRYLHLVLSTMKGRPHEFAIVGLLRYGGSLEEATRPRLQEPAARPADEIDTQPMPL